MGKLIEELLVFKKLEWVYMTPGFRIDQFRH